jgi:hypothetical protein
MTTDVPLSELAWRGLRVRTFDGPTVYHVLSVIGPSQIVSLVFFHLTRAINGEHGQANKTSYHRQNSRDIFSRDLNFT